MREKYRYYFEVASQASNVMQIYYREFLISRAINKTNALLRIRVDRRNTYKISGYEFNFIFCFASLSLRIYFTTVLFRLMLERFFFENDTYNWNICSWNTNSLYHLLRYATLSIQSFRFRTPFHKAFGVFLYLAIPIFAVHFH